MNYSEHTLTGTGDFSSVLRLPNWESFNPRVQFQELEALIKHGIRLAEDISAQSPTTFDALVFPFECLEDDLSACWSPMGHMNNVLHDAFPELEDLYSKGTVLLSRFASEIGQHEGLYNVYKRYHDSDDYRFLSPEKKKLIDDKIRDFTLAGIALSSEKREELKKINEQLAVLSDMFENNIQKAQKSWRKIVTDENDLSGLSAVTSAALRLAAKREGIEGFLVTIHGPVHLSIMTSARHRELRREVYEAYNTRASDQGPDKGKWDNAPIIRQILDLRHRKARLLGSANYNEYSLARKMAPSVDAVTAFLDDLNGKVHPVAEKEFAALEVFAKEKLGMEEIFPWDDLYVREKYRRHMYGIDQEMLRSYFPLDKVLSGLFGLLEKIYGITFRERDVSVWTEGVRFFEIYDDKEELRGGVYFDLYARDGKHPGAWHDSCAERFFKRGVLQLPVGYVNCNFTPPAEGEESFLLHDEIVTFYHECGHALHHALTRADYPSLSMGQIEWDAIEYPSQIMEEWCWEPQMLRLMSAHKHTREPLSDDIIATLRKSKLCNSGLFLARQLSFGLFDWSLHRTYDSENIREPQELWNEVRKSVMVAPMPEWNRFINSFSHIFGGGYAASYYSYLWAEVLSADAFAEFRDKGIFSRAVGMRFLSDVLEQGAMRPMMESFKAFRGREPDSDALLKQYGLS